MKDHLPCTLCIWFDKDTPATWHGRAPTGSWHYLCDFHHQAYGRKYSTLTLMSAATKLRLLQGRSPYGKD